LPPTQPPALPIMQQRGRLLVLPVTQLQRPTLLIMLVTLPPTLSLLSPPLSPSTPPRPKRMNVIGSTSACLRIFVQSCFPTETRNDHGQFLWQGYLP
jgi:hypothetical protein